jgi:predicted dehydrogenase
MPGRVRIGFVGTGGIAGAHIERLREIPEAQIVALCDVDEGRVQAAAEPLGSAVFTDASKLIEQAEIDALYICVPPHAHGDIEVTAARKGLHLFVEKPVSLYLDQAQRALKAIREAGVMTQTGYVLRYFPGSEQLKEFLADKPVGTAHVSRWNGLPGLPWWRRYDQGGGQLVEMTTHQVDLLRWVMGEVEAVSACYSFDRLHREEPGVTVPDSQAVLLQFASGAVATINTSCAVGSAGLMSMDLAIRDARVNWKSDGITVEPADAYPVSPLPATSGNIDEAFVRAVSSGDRSLLRSPYDDAMKSLSVTLAANLSAEQGGRLVRMKELLKE